MDAECRAGFQMLIALVVIAVSLARMVPAPSWLGWYTLAFILLFDSAYAWSCESPPASLHQRCPIFLHLNVAVACCRSSSPLHIWPDPSIRSSMLPLEAQQSSIRAGWCLQQYALPALLSSVYLPERDGLLRRGPPGLAVPLRDPAAGDAPCWRRCRLPHESALQLRHRSASHSTSLCTAMIAAHF